MPNPVVIEFLMKGIPNIAAGLRQVEDTFTKFEKARTTTAQREESRRTAIRDRSASMAGRYASQEAARLNAIRTNSAKMAGQHAAKMAAAEAKAAAAGVRAVETAEQRKTKAIERETARRQAIRERSAAMAGKHAAHEARSEKRERDKATNLEAIERYHNRRRFISYIGGSAAQGVAKGAGRVANIAQGVAGMVSGLGGGFSIGDSAQRAIANKGKAADIANSGYQPNSDDPRKNVKRSSSDIMAAAQKTAARSGITTEDALGGLEAFTAKTGDLATGLETMDKLAELSRATGANFHDVASAAGDVMSQLGDIPDKAKAVDAVMRGIAGQGKLGAVEMKDLASQMAKLAASAGQFGGNAVDNILKMGMLAQEARAGGGAASATIAATSVTGFVNTLKTPARIAAFKSKGISVFDKDKNLRGPDEIIMESLEKTGGDPEQMKKLFANVMGERAVGSYSNAYRKAETTQKGSGKAVVQGMFDKQLKGATMSEKDVSNAFGDRMKEVDAQMAINAAKFDEAVATKLIPKLIELMPAIEKLIPQFVDMAATALPPFIDLLKTIAKAADTHKDSIAFLASHPIGALIVGEVTKSMATAGIGEALKGAIQLALGKPGGAGSLIPGVGGTAPAGGGLVGGASKLFGAGVGGAVGIGVGTGLAAAAITANAMLKYEGGTSSAEDMAAKVKAYGRGDREGGMSPAQAAAEIDAAKGRLKEHGGALEQAANLISSPILDRSSKDYDQYKRDQAVVDNENLKKALEEVTAAIKTLPNAMAQGAASTGANGAARDTSIIARP